VRGGFHAGAFKRPSGGTALNTRGSILGGCVSERAVLIWGGFCEGALKSPLRPQHRTQEGLTREGGFLRGLF
jgi:hypothetical protein